MATVICAPVESEMFRLQLVKAVFGRAWGMLSVHGATGSCRDGEEGICVVVISVDCFVTRRYQ